MANGNLSTVNEGNRPVDPNATTDTNSNAGCGAVVQTTTTPSTTTTGAPPAGNDSNVDAQANSESGIGEGNGGQTAPNVTNWDTMSTFEGQVGLTDAFKNFIDTREDGTVQQPSPDNVNGRSKTLIFTYKHSPSPNEFETGNFQIILRYPSATNASGTGSGSGAATGGGTAAGSTTI
jgi:hypothetical protein